MNLYDALNEYGFNEIYTLLKRITEVYPDVRFSAVSLRPELPKYIIGTSVDLTDWPTTKRIDLLYDETASMTAIELIAKVMKYIANQIEFDKCYEKNN